MGESSQQRLIFAGRQLQDNVSLAACGVLRGSLLHVVLRLRGGTSPGRLHAQPQRNGIRIWYETTPESFGFHDQGIAVANAFLGALVAEVGGASLQFYYPRPLLVWY